MAHGHTIGVRFTGPDIADGEGHYHELSDGARTSTDPEGPRHTHSVPSGDRTSGPVPLPGDDPDAESRRRKKKKKKDY